MNPITDEEQQYRRFRQLQLMKKKHYSCFISGSCLELPVGYLLCNPTDVDKMYWAKNVTASHIDDANHDQRFPNPTFTIDTKDCHSGFARLRKVHSPHDNGDCSYYRKPSTPSIEAGNGPSWPKFIRVKSNSTATISLLGCFNQIFSDIATFKMDYVYAVYCPSWPSEAAEWVTRERRNGWPSKDAIGKIVGLGCHLVAKPHQSTPGDGTQWRFSFSQAEVILINGWTDVQKYIYHVLRLIKSEVVQSCGGEEKTVLCTYFFKTLMLWACEEKPPEFWTDENLETSVGELLCQMIEWLIEKRCPNYFIPSNNMLVHLEDDVHLSNEISALLCCKETMLAKLLTKAPRAFLEIPLNFLVPSTIMEFTLLAINNSYTHDDLHATLGTLPSILSASDNFVPELRYLFNAIQAQLRLTKVMGDPSEFGPDDISFIVANFESAKIGNDSRSLAVQLFLRSSASDWLDDLSSFADTHYGPRSSNSTAAVTERRYENLNRPTDETGYNKSSSMRDTSDFSYRPTQRLSNHQEKEKFDSCHFRESSGDLGQNSKGSYIAEESVTGYAIGLSSLLQNLARRHSWTSPAHLISSAYCANFYYASLQDYGSATKQCRMAFWYLKGLDSNTLGVHAKTFTKAFSVLLMNEYSALFDWELQLLLGFITLSTHVAGKYQSRPSRKSIAIHICPLEFLKYIHFQCVRKSNGIEPVYIKCNYREAAVSMFNGQCDYEFVSRILLLTAIRISGIMPSKIEDDDYLVRWP